MGPPKNQPQDQEVRRREVEREMANARAENELRMAQCDPNETARQAQENLAAAQRQGVRMPKADPGPKSARPRPEVPGG
jgi:hypothetical protein